MNKKIIYALGILMVISLIYPLSSSIIKAKIDSTGATSEVVGSGDILESAPGLTLSDVPADGTPATINDNYGNTVLTDKGGSVGIERNISIPANFDANGNPIPFDANNLLMGLDAARDQNASGNYEKGAWDAFKDNQFAVFDKDSMKVEYNPETKTYDIKVNAEISKADLAANAQRTEAANRIINEAKNGANIEKLVNDIMKNTLGISKENPEYQNQYNAIMEMAKDPKKAEQWKAWLDSQKMIMVNIKYIPPKQKVEKSPVPKDGGACAKWNAQGQPGAVSCLGAGSKQGFRSPCTVSQTQEFMSSYTTTTPNNSDPYIKGRQPFCDDQREGYLDFSEIMNTFGHRVWSKDDLMNNGVSAFNRFRMQDRFANNPWKSSWRGEVREWNPFREGNKLSGIPYQIIWGDELDSWTDADHRINPMITESINHRDKAERSNARFTAKYGLNDPLKVYNNAPNPRMRVTSLDLDNNAWNQGDTSNIYCVSQYDMKVEPRYDILQWDRYRLFDLHRTTGPSWTYSCKCVKKEKYRCCKRYGWEDDWEEYCKKWGRYGCEDYGWKKTRSYVCKQWGTCERCVKEEHVKVDLGGVNTKYPKGHTTSGPTPAGSIPPIYKQRRKYQYRIGGSIEYHAIARNTINPRFRPVPDSYRDPSKIKAGYGFNYTSGMQVITDYDRDPRTYNASPVIIRPNKAVPLNIARNNYLGNYGRFNPNVRFDSARNAPERSSSINENFIEEDLRGRMIRTTFNPREISNAKESNRELGTGDIGQSPVSSSVRRIPINWGERTTSFRIDSDPNRYYHAYWRTRGEENLVPAYRPGPLHYIYLDYLSGTDYTVGSLEFIRLNNRGFGVSAFNSGSIRVVGNMWEDSFSRPDFRKSGDFHI